MDFYFHFLILLSGDIELNPGPGPSLRSARIFYANIRGLHRNLADLSLASGKFDILCCSETLATERRSPVELLIPNFNRPILIPWSPSEPDCKRRGMAVYIRSCFPAYRRIAFECACAKRHEFVCVRVCSKYHNFYVFFCYRNPIPDDSIYDCLLDNMGAAQVADSKAAFLFVGDFNAPHSEWLPSGSPTSARGESAFEFGAASGTTQLIKSPTHHVGDGRSLGNCLDLAFTDVPGLVAPSVGTPIGTSDHSYISLKLQLLQNISSFTTSRRIYLKSLVNWGAVDQDVRSIPWSEIYSSSNPISALNSALSDIIVRRVPSRIVKHRQGDKPWFNDLCERAYCDKQAAYRQWKRDNTRQSWIRFAELRVQAQAIYTEAERQHRHHARDILSDCNQPHRWWQTLKTSVFGSASCLPPLISGDGTVTDSPTDKSRMFSAAFNAKQSNQTLNLPPTCFPQPAITSFAFRSSKVLSILSGLDSHGGVDPNGIFPLFLKENRRFLAPKLSVIFRKLIRTGSFPYEWRHANVIPIPKSSSSVHPEDFRPISITPCISKIYEKLLCHKLMRFVESHNLLPPGQFAYRKGLGTCDALLSLTCPIQAALDRSSEVCAVCLDFSAAFDRICHSALLYKLESLGVGGPLLGVVGDFLHGRSQSVVVDGVHGSPSPVMSGVPQGSVLGPILFIIFTSDMWDSIENELISYADDTTLFREVGSSSSRASAAASLNRDLERISQWCVRWGMKLNPSKTQIIYFSRSKTLEPAHPPLFLGESELVPSDHIKVLGVVLDSKLTFKKHILSLVSSLSSKVGILRKSLKIFNDVAVAERCFFSFLLPIFEYCSPVWGSSKHLPLLDKVFRQIIGILPDLNLDLYHRRDVASLCMFYKILNNSRHPVHCVVPPKFACLRKTRNNLNFNSRALRPHLCKTEQFRRDLLSRCVRYWNCLPEEIVSASNAQLFKLGVNSFLLSGSVAPFGP